MKPHSVFIDVYPWVQAIHQQYPNQSLPMSGIFRHAEFLCQHFQPAMVVMPGEHPMSDAAMLLQQYIQKPVMQIRSQSSNPCPSQFGCEAWVNLAPDCAGPASRLDADYEVVTIVHDAQAMIRDFGPMNKSNFHRAVETSDVFLFVSKTAHKQYEQATQRGLLPIPKVPPKQIMYGCTHGLHELPVLELPDRSELNLSHSWFSLSVSSIYPHKRLDRIAELVEWMQCRHVHVGRFLKPTDEEILACLRDGIQFAGGLNDSSLVRLYGMADLFVCLSEDEGFSMPAMEAVLYGNFPRLILSDIPAHQEIYGGFDGAVFVPLDKRPSEALTDLGMTKLDRFSRFTSQDRNDLFKRYHPDTVLRGLREHLGLES